MKKTALFVIILLALTGCKKKSEEASGGTKKPAEAAPKKAVGDAMSKGVKAASHKSVSVNDSKKAPFKKLPSKPVAGGTPVTLGKFVKAPEPAFDVAAQFGTKLVPRMFLHIDLKALLATAEVRKKVGGIIMKGAQKLKSCTKEVQLDNFGAMLMVSSSTNLIGKPGEEKARYAIIEFTKPMSALFECLKKEKIIAPSKKKGLFMMTQQDKTFVSMPSPNRFILAKGEWAEFLSKKGILASGDILSKLTKGGVYFYVGGDKNEVKEMKIVATFLSKFGFTANINFVSEADCKRGLQKLNFLKHLPPKMGAAFAPLKYGVEKGSLSIHFDGTGAEAKRMMDVVTMMFFMRSKGPRSDARPAPPQATKALSVKPQKRQRPAMEPTMGPISWTSIKRKKPAAAKK